MSYSEQFEKILRALDFACTKNLDVVKTFIANYRPELVDLGIDMDRLHAENERLTAVVNLIDLKTERDDLKQRLDALEKANADA